MRTSGTEPGTPRLACRPIVPPLACQAHDLPFPKRFRNCDRSVHFSNPTAAALALPLTPAPGPAWPACTQPCRHVCAPQLPAPALASSPRRANSLRSQQQAGPQPCCKVLTHTEHSLSPRTLLAPSSSCADILIVLLWELAGSLSSGMARRGARAGCWLRLLLREAAHSDRLSNNLNLLRRACGTPAGPLYLLH